MSPREQAASAATITPEEFGVGVRFSLHPMSDRFADLILQALEDADRRRLRVETDEVSTYLTGPEDDLVAYLVEVIGAVARSGVHTVAHILFSRGCPGEVTCEPADGELMGPGDVAHPHPTGLHASADWSLYPLIDNGGSGDHMAEIERAVAVAREGNVSVRPLHYATRLEGDLADILSTVAGAWLAVGRTVAHVVSHVTVSLNSPTEVGR